jgi:DNA-binding MarR family transcriptional regulator
MTTGTQAALPSELMTVFTPSAIDINILKEITVARDTELRIVTHAIDKASAGTARPHVLVVGPRGSGKSHLMALAAHHVSSMVISGKHVQLAWFAEDIYSITSYRDLLFEMLTQVTGSYPDESLTAEELEQKIVEKYRTGGAIVAIIENMDRLIGLIGTSGQHCLRALIQNHQCIVLLTTAPALFDAVTSATAPLFGSFRTIHLNELTVDEGRTLLIRLASRDQNSALVTFLNSPKGLDRLRAVEHLAGGSPRLWMLLAGCITPQLLDELAPLFIKLLDELTPYYKARLDELPPSQAKLVASLCRNGGKAATVTTLAQRTNSSQQSTSKLLHELEKTRFVNAIKVPGTDQRTTYYRLREPLLRHCLDLKSTKSGMITAIVEILRSWFDTSERMKLLATSQPDSFQERHVVASLDGVLTGSDYASITATPARVLSLARSRMADSQTTVVARFLEYLFSPDEAASRSRATLTPIQVDQLETLLALPGTDPDERLEAAILLNPTRDPFLPLCREEWGLVIDEAVMEAVAKNRDDPASIAIGIKAASYPSEQVRQEMDAWALRSIARLGPTHEDAQSLALPRWWRHPDFSAINLTVLEEKLSREPTGRFGITCIEMAYAQLFAGNEAEAVRFLQRGFSTFTERRGFRLLWAVGAFAKGCHDASLERSASKCFELIDEEVQLLGPQDRALFIDEATRGTHYFAYLWPWVATVCGPTLRRMILDFYSQDLFFFLFAFRDAPFLTPAMVADMRAIISTFSQPSARIIENILESALKMAAGETVHGDEIPSEVLPIRDSIALAVNRGLPV